jgi:CHAD domain-containing protein
MLRRLQTLRVDPTDPDQVHRRRRLLRRVRYAAELLDRPSDGLARLQDALGELSDSCLLHRALPQAVDPTALRHALRAAEVAWTRYAPHLKDLE